MIDFSSHHAELHAVAQRRPRLQHVTLTVLLAGALAFSAGCVNSTSSSLAKEQEEQVNSMMKAYQREARRMAEAETRAAANAVAVNVAKDEPLFAAHRVTESLPAREMSLQDLWVSALKNSSQIRVFSELPLIRATAIQEARGLFDAEVFVDGRYYDRDDPVGSTLTTGGNETRFLEQESRISAGVRKKFSPGTELYLSQELTHIDNNSQYLQPNPQAGAKLVIGGVQPLLNGAGMRYNTSVIEIAKLDTELAHNEFLRQMESHMLEIARTYWSLQMSRGVALAKQRALAEAESVLNELESRGDFDAANSQILRAKAVTAERRAALIRSESAVRNSTERIKALVNDPALMEAGSFELIPTDLPLTARGSVDMETATREALQKRPEIRQAYLQLQAAVLRREMSINERLPTLNAYAEAYLAGLAYDDREEAYNNQYEGDGPGYMVGLRFEFPLGNNEAKAVNIRRRLELRQLGHQLQTTMETVLLDVKISVREVDTSLRDLAAKQESMAAAREELDNLHKRKEALILGGDANAVGQLNLLLDAQERQADAEERFLQAMATHNVAMITLQRAQGTLLTSEDVTTTRESVEDEGIRKFAEDRELPVMRVQTLAP